MAQREKDGRVVFIGNIPYGVSEEQIMDIFARCGQVLNFRLVYDKDTGQPKGFGFLEFSDVDAAASAVRNLADFELNGRTLRVAYSNDNRGGAANNQNQDASKQFSVAQYKPDPAALPPIPTGKDLPPGLTVYDAISQTLRTQPTPQLLDFISQLKNLCISNPGQATNLFQSQPQLGYAVFQAMCLMNLVDPTVVGQLVASVQPAPAPQLTHPPPPNPYQQPPQPQPQPAYPSYPPQPQYGGAQYVPTPPPQQVYQPSAPQPAAQPEPNDPQTQALLAQVKALTKEQIYSMEPTARDQILGLRAIYGPPVV